MVEGAGSGAGYVSISVANGSGCGSVRPKNILQIRIRNNALKFRFSDQSSSQLSNPDPLPRPSSVVGWSMENWRPAGGSMSSISGGGGEVRPGGELSTPPLLSVACQKIGVVDPGPDLVESATIGRIPISISIDPD
jgi:hypothetical protein